MTPKGKNKRRAFLGVHIAQPYPQKQVFVGFEKGKEGMIFESQNHEVSLCLYGSFFMFYRQLFIFFENNKNFSLKFNPSMLWF